MNHTIIALNHWRSGYLASHSLACLIALLAWSWNSGPLLLAQSTDAAAWKQETLASLHDEVQRSDSKTAVIELQARIRWLSGWLPGTMVAAPKNTAQLPAKRIEPRLTSPIANQIFGNAIPEVELIGTLRYWANRCPTDPAVQQALLHWMDNDPTRRKEHLIEIENTTVRLIQLLQNGIACQPEPRCQLALEFARYRRARALAYRELPDVVAKHPITDPARLDQRIQAAFDELIREAGSGRTEFVLLEIRMQRRVGNRGQALMMLEEFGPTISPKWYQKKRRDLLKELGWNLPHQEAASIFAQNFPEEVARERAQQLDPPRLQETEGQRALLSSGG